MSNRPSDSQIPPFFPTLVFIGSIVLLLVLLLPAPTPPPQTLALQTEMAIVTIQPTTVVLVPTNVPPTIVTVSDNSAAVLVEEGRGIFSSVCSACHGLDARGIPGLGKNLIESQYVHSLSDEELLHFITTGRDTSDPLNTTGIPMPPRGGNPSLTDEQLRSVIAFLRSESGSTPLEQAAPTTIPGVVQVAPTGMPAPRLEATILPTSIPVTPQPFSAQSVYAWSCAGCHSIDGKGNLPFAGGYENSPLLADRAALLNFLIAAHPPTDPGIEFPHPPRGGYPMLNDEQLAALLDYVVSMGTS
jgi:disulfide bond formation protein DsbB